MRIVFPLSFFFVLILHSCNSGLDPDMILYNGDIHTIEEGKICSCLVSTQGRISFLSKEDEECLAKKGSKTKLIDLKGSFAMPGFIEGHGHFNGVGRMAQNLNFLDNKSWESILSEIEAKVPEIPKGSWIEGRGWHQEKWDSLPPLSIMGYPTKYSLDSISPDHPVVLFHASGHGLFANSAAMEIAGITRETPDPPGGKIIKDQFGEPTGVFEERAATRIRQAYTDYLAAQGDEARKAVWRLYTDAAQQECLAKGITSFQDAGSSYEDIDWYKEMAEKGELDLRLWVMLRHSFEQMENNMQGFPIIGAGDEFFTCRAIKTEVDGALGAHGAWLLEDYEDRPGFKGQNTTETAEVERIAGLSLEHDMQLCVHSIGDRANREVLDIFEKSKNSKPEKTDWRWRVEHAQHLHPDDIKRFASLGAIASMQGIHCTSDAPFVVKRLGTKRAQEGGYAWRSLLDAGVVIANGTDAPVEDVDPLPSLYASVTRKRTAPEMTFFEEQKMTRAEALYSYTLGNAYAGFEEKIKGSLKVGKLTDVVVLSENLLSCPEERILDAKVLYTIVGGEVKYQGG
ncbi:MAG: amidohydrolase [Saprospiraceae bacterium]|nr:amidohydrolase [Saprospiraceae bacterium]